MQHSLPVYVESLGSPTSSKSVRDRDRTGLNNISIESKSVRAAVLLSRDDMLPSGIDNIHCQLLPSPNISFWSTNSTVSELKVCLNFEGSHYVMLSKTHD